MNPQPAYGLLEPLRTYYPLLVLPLFILASVVDGMIIARRIVGNDFQQISPGEGPLPKRTRSYKAVQTEEWFSDGDKFRLRWLSLSLCGTYLADATIYTVHVMIAWSENWWGGQSIVIYIVCSFCNYTVLLRHSHSPTAGHAVCWIFAIPFELTITGLSIYLYTSLHHEPVVGDREGGPVRNGVTTWELMEAATASFRILILLALAYSYVVTFTRSLNEDRTLKDGSTLTETAPLLRFTDLDSGYNAAADLERHPFHYQSWPGPISACSLLLSYMWPSESRCLKTTAMVCFLLLLIQRIVNVLVPAQLGVIFTTLEDEKEGSNLFILWSDVAIWVFCYWLQGILGDLRSGLWLPVRQYAYKNLATSTLQHIHRLDWEFHRNKDTGEVMSALRNATQVTDFLEQAVFRLFPTLLDLVIAVWYFLIAFDAYFALLFGVFSFIYIGITIRLAQWRKESRRQEATASRNEDAVKNDSIASYAAVKYFNGENKEVCRYRHAVRGFQWFQSQSSLRRMLLNTTQTTILSICLLLTGLIAVYEVFAGLRPAGQFATLVAYMSQLQRPLTFFGKFYLLIQSALIDAERMLQLIIRQPMVFDRSHATHMGECEGGIKFQNVEFFYDARKPILRGLTFECPSGTTTALVGESGGGKSTVLQLIYRLYNATKGDIFVGGHSVHDVTIESLQRQIGIVPQAPVLFNETFMYNLKYANQDAEDSDVYEACRAAGIHSQIVACPDGYDTKVGEQGSLLSGGEKQRVALAQAILKNTKFILMDEATAALDTGTEKHVLKSLRQLTTGRTVLIVAHRLSTIVDADKIMVIHGGRVAESGTHQQLLMMHGHYAKLWSSQSMTLPYQ
ncbi:uncharacterized protein N7483_002518 [Penicillium malachiteum]|uniref:uncharacterized protein n=1 Tax=Penicillium malachiteum TaxID=1324776 RepID=UPI0025482950|nr:uncharacterized protein N7483_002518 [Penicillium malachiteum]KAJ5737393.1 hypothetical protein N7483_002518 [Penicillium malachiteum]